MSLFGFQNKQVKEWKKQAKAGDAQAQYKLARAYASGKGARQNYDKAVEYCKEAAAQELADAQALLAHFYGHGKGVEQDDYKMAYWAEKSALQGNALSQYNLGRCYELGRGKNKNMEKALRWYTLAAEKGRTDAAYKLGWCYENGVGVEPDHVLAEEWFAKAAGKPQEEYHAEEADSPNDDRNRKYRCISEMKVGEGILMKENQLLESPFVLTKAENHETELGWGKARITCNTGRLLSLTTGEKRTAVLYCGNRHVSKAALKSFQDQVDDPYNHERMTWNEPHRKIQVVLKNVRYNHKHEDAYYMSDLVTSEEYEVIPQGWARPILDKLEYNTMVTIAYYGDKWYFVSKKETPDVGRYKFHIQ